MAQDYMNIPVKRSLYFKIKMIAELNGLGERGMGAQLDIWAERELPDCAHEKQLVTIEVFPGNTALVSGHRKGLFCPICNRVYQYVDAEAIVPVKVRTPKGATA